MICGEMEKLINALHLIVSFDKCLCFTDSVETTQTLTAFVQHFIKESKGLNIFQLIKQNFGVYFFNLLHIFKHVYWFSQKLLFLYWCWVFKVLHLIL